MSFDEGLDSAMTETINISFGFLENFLWFLKPVLLRFLMLSTEKNSSGTILESMPNHLVFFLHKFI